MNKIEIINNLKDEIMWIDITLMRLNRIYNSIQDESALTELTESINNINSTKESLQKILDALESQQLADNLSLNNKTLE